MGLGLVCRVRAQGQVIGSGFTVRVRVRVRVRVSVRNRLGRAAYRRVGYVDVLCNTYCLPPRRVC